MARAMDAVRTAVAAEYVNGLTTLEIYTGAPPAVGAAATGTLLATITVSWAAGAAGVQAISGTPSATAGASGTAGWGRFRNAGDTRRIDGTVGADFTLADTNIVSGGTVTVTSGSITVPVGT